jgi:hypothetical protein
VALGASFHGSFPSVRQTVWHPQTKTLKDAADAAIKSAIYMLNRRSCWDALHEIQRVVDISGDIGALPALAVDLHLGRKPQEVKLFVCPKNRFAVSGPFMPVSGALVIAIAMPPTKANPPTTAMVDRLT